MDINLYEELNEKIADILAIEKDPSSLYASAYIKQLRAEIKAFKDKLESGQLVELPKPFIGEGENAYGETTYLVYRSKVETYCPSEDIFTDKAQAEARLKELWEKL